MGVGRRISGEGPDSARIMVIAEHPSKAEAASGRLFASRFNRPNEIDRFFDGIRLPSRSEVFLTYWVREWCGEDADYTAADYDHDLPELHAEIRRIQPEIIVALGREVCRLFLGDIDVEEVHGLQWWLPETSPTRELFDAPEKVIVAANYNPAAGFRNADLSAAIAYDFAQFEMFLEGSLKAKTLFDDPYPNPTYLLLKGQEVCDLLSLYQ